MDMSNFKEIIRQIDGRSRRERIALLLIVSLFPLVIGYNRVIQPMRAESARLNQEMAETQSFLSTLENRRIALQSALINPPVSKEEMQLNKLKTEWHKIEEKVHDAAARLVPPQEMTRALKALLATHPGIDFISLETVEAVPIMPPKPELSESDDQKKTTARSTPIAYRHGLKLTFEGSFMESQSFFASIRQLPWSFFWEAVEYKVTTHPNAEVALILYTISPDKEALGA